MSIRQLSSEDAWKGASARITHKLPLGYAEKLARTYSEAAAIVLRETTGEPIGCITIEIPIDSRAHIRGQLVRQLTSAARQVENVLQRKHNNV